MEDVQNSNYISKFLLINAMKKGAYKKYMCLSPLSHVEYTALA